MKFGNTTYYVDSSEVSTLPAIQPDMALGRGLLDALLAEAGLTPTAASDGNHPDRRDGGTASR